MLGGGQRSAEPPPRGNRRNIPSDTCERFRREILFPSWRRRDKVLRYCSHVAEAPGSIPQEEGTKRPSGAPDERLDPYSARDYSWSTQSDVQQLRAVLGNEEGVERIVRSRTWAVLGERCTNGSDSDIGSMSDESWVDTYDRWMKECER